jgi:hypothetical protein
VVLGDNMDYKAYHDELTYCYYNQIPLASGQDILTKAEFERLHTLNWLYLERENTIAEIQSNPRSLEEINAQIIALGGN